MDTTSIGFEDAERATQNAEKTFCRLAAAFRNEMEERIGKLGS